MQKKEGSALNSMLLGPPWWFRPQDLGSIPGLGRPLENLMATHFSILALVNPMDSLVGHSPRGHKELDMTEELTPGIQYRSHCP